MYYNVYLNKSGDWGVMPPLWSVWAQEFCQLLPFGEKTFFSGISTRLFPEHFSPPFFCFLLHLCLIGSKTSTLPQLVGKLSSSRIHSKLFQSKGEGTIIALLPIFRRSLLLLLPTLSFIAIYSILPHKELRWHRESWKFLWNLYFRFIIYSIPLLNTAAAMAAAGIWRKRCQRFPSGHFPFG